jgi:hypothetical protein
MTKDFPSSGGQTRTDDLRVMSQKVAVDNQIYGEANLHWGTYK